MSTAEVRKEINGRGKYRERKRKMGKRRIK
jgi:hypothetical protein